MSSVDNIIAVADRIGSIAESIHNKLRYFVVLGILASSVLAYYVFDGDSSWWWNTLKVGVLLAPAFIWLMVLLALRQLREAPELVSKLVNDDDGLFENINSFSLKEPSGLKGLVSTVRAFRQEDGLGAVFDTISGVGLMVNPFFLFLSFFALVVLFMFILIAPFVLLF